MRENGVLPWPQFAFPWLLMDWANTHFPVVFFYFSKNDYSCLLSNFVLVLILICRLIYIFWIPILSQLCIAILFAVCILPLHSLHGVFLYIKVLNLNAIKFISLFFEYFTSCLKNVCILWVHEDSSLHFISICFKAHLLYLNL